MQLMPIPADVDTLRDMLPHWAPFLHDIAKRTKEPIADLFAKVARFAVQPILIWDEAELKAVALLGIAYHRRGEDRIAELIWAAGKGMTHWRHLLADLEKYLAEHEGVSELRPICRPGWSRYLVKHGYKITHYMMEKALVPAQAGNREKSHGKQW